MQAILNSLNSNAKLKEISKTFKDYLSLTKPGVLVLLLISTVCPMFVAAGVNLSFELVFWTLLGGALISGSASAINCVYDTDIDSIMKRTKKRPIPDGRISQTSASVSYTHLTLPTTPYV